MTDKNPRTDKRRNVGKVAEVLAKNPNKTVREIAKETDLGTGTVQRAKEEVEQSGTKDPTIAYIVGSAKNRLKRISGIFDRYIDEVEVKEELSSFDVRTIKDIAKDDQTRITVLGGDTTDESGGLKEITINNKQQDAINSLLEKLL